jgi:cell division initiation protein
MSLTPVEIRHIQLKRGLFGYRKKAVHGMMDDVADSFEAVWRERSQLVERVDELETEVSRHMELEGLLRSTLISAERASQDLRESARREAEVIVTEAHAEGRKVLREAIAEKEHLMADVRRVQSILRSALAVVDETPAEAEDEDPGTDSPPGWPAQPGKAASTAVALPPRPEEVEGSQKLAG